MLAFLIRSLSSSRMRTFSIFIAVFLSSCVMVFFTSLYANIVSAITFYTLDGVDETRFTLTTQTNFFQLLDREKGGLPTSLISQIENDKDIISYKEFTFIDIPVLGKFDVFAFSLDIDIPTFAVKYSGTGMLDGIGISRSMIRYYNAQFAGSHIMFPLFEEHDLIGRKVSLAFGASKLFSLPENRDAIYSSEISHIESDYPGFGVVLPHNVATEKMGRLGRTLPPPYKIIGYMSDPKNRGDILTRYKGFDISFDQDILDEKKTMFRTLSQILFLIGGGIVLIIYGFIFLLFLGFFREKSDVYDLIHQYKIPFRGKFFLILLEPVLLIMLSIFIVLTIVILFQPLLIETLSSFFNSKNIFFPVASLTTYEIVFLIFSNALILFLFLFGIFFRKG